MGRPHKPNEITRLNPGRGNASKYDLEIPKTDKPLGVKPFRLSAEAAKAWDEIVEAVPATVLVKTDRMIMELTCELMGEFRENPRQFATSKIGQLLACMSRLGLTPSDRVKLGVKKDGDKGNAFDDF